LVVYMEKLCLARLTIKNPIFLYDYFFENLILILNKISKGKTRKK